jgi:hypothetical protein
MFMRNSGLREKELGDADSVAGEERFVQYNGSSGVAEVLAANQRTPKGQPF